MSTEENKYNLTTLESELALSEILRIILSISDFLLILDSNEYCFDIKFSTKFKEKNIISNQFLNKNISDFALENDTKNKIKENIDKLKKTNQEQNFDLEIKLKSETQYFNTRIFALNNKELNFSFYIISGLDITKNKQTHIKLSDDLFLQSNKVKQLEKDINFYIKQGDIITNQKAKIQKERDELAKTKDELAKQKKLMETDMDFIMKQGDNIAQQKHKIKKQHDIVRKQKKKIEDSIFYAKRIQSAVLPPNQFIQHLLAEHFILYKPRDIVSGDFYWIKQVDDRIFIAAADCTGHGVPGALMSMLGITFLNEIINKDPNIHANEILNELRIHVISSLHQTGSIGESRDGMDIALCIINHKNKTMEFSGANNPLFLIRNGELLSIRGCKMPIGIHRKSKESFVNHYLDLYENDLIYLFSDGYIDQFGGEFGRKYLTSNFKDLLLKNSKESLKKQKQILEQTFYDWKGDYKQLDDILIIGFKVLFNKISKIKKNYNWEGKTILVAEDDNVNYVILHNALQKTKAKIIRVKNGKEAINECKSNSNIDIVLMDIKMPIMDGIEATSQIKIINNDLPIIVQTSFTMSSEKEKSFKAGCDDYISKPVNEKELYATINKYI